MEKPTLRLLHHLTKYSFAGINIRVVMSFVVITTCFVFPAEVKSKNSAEHSPEVSQSRLGDKYELPEISELYLDVIVNGVHREVHSFEQEGEDLWASPVVLKEIGLVLPEQSASRLNIFTLDGVKAEYNVSQQQLVFTVAEDQAELPVNTLSNFSVEKNEANSSSGALINYDIFTTRNRNNKISTSGFSETRIFTSHGVLSNTSLSLFSGEKKGDTTRLDTSLSYSSQARLMTVRAGDTVTGALPWSRATRIGGIQIARNFGLNPYQVNSPLLEFMGTTVEPTTVDLLINGIKQYSATVPPGPFAINALPSINGYGVAQVVLTDASGKAKTVELPLFISHKLLRKNMADWSVDIGKVRQDYGIKSFRYSKNGMFNSKLRYGVADKLTLEGQIEYTPKLVKAGVGGLLVPHSTLGLISGSYAQSRYLGLSGTQWGVDYQWNNKYFNVGTSLLQADEHYRDVASLYGAGIGKKSQRLFFGVHAGVVGSVSFGHITQTYFDRERTRFGSFSWARSVGESIGFNLSVNQDLDNRSDRSIYLGVSVALADKINISTNAVRQKSGSTLGASATRAVDSEGGFGWSVNEVLDDIGRNTQGEIDYQGKYIKVIAGGNSRLDSYAGMNGAAVFMDGHTFLSQQVNDAFAVVSTDGVPNIPVLLENRLVGNTDSSGLLLVSPLYSYQKNTISIDSLKLPSGYEIDYVTTSTVPSEKSGNYVQFPLKSAHAALITLRDSNGVHLPVGTQVFLKEKKSNSSFTVGFDGVVYLSGLSEVQEIEAHLPPKDNQPGIVCYATVEYQLKENDIDTLPDTTCAEKEKH